jgi:hypothetical protein
MAIMNQIYCLAVVTIAAAYEDGAECELSRVKPGNRALDQLPDQGGPSLTLAVELPYVIKEITKAP